MTEPPERPSYSRTFLQFAGVALACIIAVWLGRDAFDASFKPAPPPPAPAPAPPPAVTAGGFTLTSTSIALPEDDSSFQGAGSDLMNANCTACHSASMVLTQPPLSRAQWTATVDKMRDTYKATIAAKDMPAIVEYLTRVSAGGGGPPAHSDQTPTAEATGATG